MSLKSWVLDSVQRIGALVSRVDLPPRDAAFDDSTQAADLDTRPHVHAADVALASAEHLGPYGPLIKAVRSELEHFIVSQLRLHLAIADRDRFLLTSIGVRSRDADDARDRLLRFMREFKPEQVKRYLAREVIAGLPNAAAIDLSQFAGLVDLDERDDAADDYADLLAELAGPRPPSGEPAYDVTLLGRWSEVEPAPAPMAAATAAPLTPLAGQRCEFDLEDAAGRRRIVLQAVVPGRRYVIGKGDGCDIVVDGAYTSRRHAELWLENGAWWAGDAGSTNGIRVEGSREAGSCSAGDAPLRLGDSARLVLSARSDGPPADFPWLALRPAPHAARPTPIAAAPQTPLTVVRPSAAFAITTTQAGGTSTLELSSHRLPISVGRSRNQTVVIDRRHDAVSGHHLDIVALDESAAHVVVHGDNGVRIDGVGYPAGTRLRWRVGQSMLLGPAAPDEAPCTLALVQTTRD